MAITDPTYCAGCGQRIVLMENLWQSRLDTARDLWTRRCVVLNTHRPRYEPVLTRYSS